MPLIPNKREFLARGLCQLGVVSLIERLARRPGLLVLTYHRIGDPAAWPFYAPVASATVETLEAELRALQRTHRVIGQEGLLALAGSGFRTDGPTALITFDDGYRDNHDAALPVLKALGLPATFFLATDFLETPRLPWWDHIAYVIRRATAPTIALGEDRDRDGVEPLTVDLRALGPAEAIDRVVWWYFRHVAAAGDAADRDFRAALEGRAGVHVDEAALGGALFMGWDEARALVASGMAIGSHSRSHRDLGRLGEGERLAELAGSKQLLERRIGGAVAMLAYPYGWPGTHDAGTARLAREAGYRVAFTSMSGVNRAEATDPFAVRRLGVGYADPPPVHRARWALHQAFGGSIL